MPYCTECGSEVGSDAKYCQDCGTQVAGPSQSISKKNESTELTESADSEPDTYELDSNDVPDNGHSGDNGVDVLLAISSIGMGVVVGFLVALAFAEIGGSGFFFIVTVVGVGHYLYTRKKSPRDAIGSGLYITAIWLILSPLLFYIGVAGESDPNSAEAVGSILGMFVWGFIGLLFAIVVGGVGYFVNRGVE